MLPYSTSFCESYTDTVGFDNITFELSYWDEDGTGDILWDQIMELQTSQITPDGNYYKWFGSIKNQSNYSITFPKIIACILKDSSMIDMDYTYLDVTDYTFIANTTAIFDSYIDLPQDYDEIKYYLSYSLYSLEGSGNIPPNWPAFTELSYTCAERTNNPIDIFLIDHDADQMQVQMNWGDNSERNWSNSYYSKSVATLSHAFAEPGIYYVKAKSSDATDSESSWSDSVMVNVLPIAELNITTAYLDEGKYLTDYSFTLDADGGITPYSWQITGGDLPPGLTLNPTSGEISGKPTKSGTYDVSISVTDDGLPPLSKEALFRLGIINNHPVLTSGNSVSATEDQLLSYTSEATDPEKNAIFYQFIDYPAWLTVTGSTISGTPLEGTKDTSFVAIASDGELADSMLVAVTVIPINDPPQFTSSNTATAYEDAPFKYTACAIDPEGSIINYTFMDFPNWLTASDSILSGTPIEGTEDFSFKVIASDGELADTLIVSVKIISINDPPQIISSSTATAYEDMPFNYIARAVDPENSPIKYSFMDYPNWLTPSDSMLAGTPLEGTQDFTFRVLASDNELTDTLLVAVTVIPINDPPKLISPDSVAAWTDSLFTYVARSIDPEGTEITYLFENYPNWMSPVDSVISGVPPFGAQDTSFVVIASDTELSDTLVVKVKLLTEFKIIALNFVKGWNMFSMNVNPAEPDIETLLAPIVDKLKIAKNGRGQNYIPAYGINQIGNINFKEGYQAYLTAGASLDVTGIAVSPDTPIELPAGWSMISYLPDVLIDAATALASLGGNVKIAKNNDGQSYIPAYGINQIGNMQPGQGYQINLTEAGTLIYPSGALSSGRNDLAVSGDTPQSNPMHFSFTPRTGQSATLVIPKSIQPAYSDGAAFEPGDEIAVFNSKGVCCGALMWQGTNAALTLWGDNDRTEITDGLTDGEMFRLRVWRKSVEKEYPVRFTSETSASGIYRKDGFFVLTECVAQTSLTAADAASHSIPTEFRLLQNYPNPFNPATLIRYELPEALNVTIEIYNHLGQRIRTLEQREQPAGIHQCAWDGRNESGKTVPSGVYFYRLQSKAFSATKKMLFMH
ncbi:putative Ig domain-containing protein [candidate division KSB1 bacterium]|nr:putative Ig domain-containing protein [candidate division KSB1 bacterium]